MRHVATTTLIRDGNAQEFTTTVDLEDIETHGIPWSQIMRKAISSETEWWERLATLMHIATLCRENGRTLDELAALRIARRMTRGGLAEINQRIGECREAGRFVQKPGENGLRVVSFQEDSAGFERLLGYALIGNNIYHPGAEFDGLTGVEGRLPLPPDPGVDNVSFAVCEGDRRLAVVPCVIHRDDVISWVALHVPLGGVPIAVHFDEPATHQGRILDLVLRHLNHLLHSFGARQFVIREPFPDGMLLFRTLGPCATYSAEVWARPVVPLTPSEDDIFAKVRKSYKSQVNWGRSNLEMEYLAGDQLTAPTVDRVHQILNHCHQELIQKYGDGMSDLIFVPPLAMCQMNKGEVAIARTKDGTVCGITVVSDEGGVSLYALGGSIPQHSKSPGQFIVYDSIIRAKARGSKFFHMNREFAAPVSIEQLQLRVQTMHERNLIFFKRGFGEMLETFNVYKVYPQAPFLAPGD